MRLSDADDDNTPLWMALLVKVPLAPEPRKKSAIPDGFCKYQNSMLIANIRASSVTAGKKLQIHLVSSQAFSLQLNT